jgi:hypothetical protein
MEQREKEKVGVKGFARVYVDLVGQKAGKVAKFVDIVCVTASNMFAYVVVMKNVI